MITIPTGDLVGILADTIPFASTDDEIPSINCIRLAWDGKLLAATSTDRYRIGCSQWEPGDIDPGEAAQDDLFSDWGSADEPWRTTIALDDAKELVKVFKLGAKEWAVPLSVDYDGARDRLKVVRARETGHSAITVVAEGTGVVFPDVDKLITDNSTVRKVDRLMFTAAFLADFAKVRPRGPLELKFTGRNGLVHATIGERFYGAIMPGRMGDADG